jgi:hypothetical protein
MSQADFWYIRFPDGRILRAASTAILRQELSAGHIPLGSTVRRAPNDEWVSLEWTQEFAELVERLAASPRPRLSEARRRVVEPHETANAAPVDASSVGSRLDASQLNLVGVRGYVEELLAALDSTLVAKKLLLGAIVGLFLGGLLVAERAAWFSGDDRWRTPALILAVAAALVLDVLAGLLTRLTYIELARLRPAGWREGLAGLGPLTFRIVLTQVLIRGSAGGLIVLLRWLPHWLGPGVEESWSMERQTVVGTVLALGMVLEAVLWTVFFLWWLVPPVLVVEECSIGKGLRQWFVLLRRHLGRVLLYQTMAVGMGVLVTAPFLALIVPLFLPTFHPPYQLSEVAAATRFFLVGLAFAPMLTYWIVANVFIYLNLRYGASGQR